MQGLTVWSFARRTLFIFRKGNINKVQMAFKSINSEEYFQDPGSPRVAVCKDGQTIAMYHPPPTVDYEKTVPIPRENPQYSEQRTVFDIARKRLRETETFDKPVENARIEHGWPFYDREVTPAVMELAEMFYTSKHRWFAKARRRPRHKK